MKIRARRAHPRMAVMLWCCDVFGGGHLRMMLTTPCCFTTILRHKDEFYFDSNDMLSLLINTAKTKGRAKSHVHRTRPAFRRRAALTMFIIGSLLVLFALLTSLMTLSSRYLKTTFIKSAQDHQQIPTNWSGIFPRAFPSWNKSSVPCHSQYQPGPFVKEQLCQSRFNHGSAVSYQYGQRNKEKSFLWSVLRDPTARFVSEFFFFQVSREGIEPTDEAFVEFVKHGGRGKFTHYFDILSTTKYNHSSTDPVAAANAILQEYDFIGVTERMDETAVALQMILGLPTASVLYISSKVNGGYDDGLYNNKCYFIQPSFISPFMKQYFESKEWNDKINWSIALHQAVNRSLDLTIDALGRNEFQEQLKKFRKAQAIVTRTCADSTLLPCSATGERRQDSETNCLFYDLGCNFECLDRLESFVAILWRMPVQPCRLMGINVACWPWCFHLLRRCQSLYLLSRRYYG